MNGIDFLDKINDIDDDLLTLETPAVKTDLRRKTLVISLASAAAVALVIGGALLIPNLMNSSSGTSVKKKDKSEKSRGDSYNASTIVEGDVDAYEEPASADDSEDSYEEEQITEDGTSTYNKSDTATGVLDMGDVVSLRVIGGAYEFDSDEGLDYLMENINIVRMTLMDDGVSINDLKLSEEGYSQYVVSDDNQDSVIVNSKTYIVYSEDKAVAFLTATKDTDGFTMLIDDRSQWLRTSGSFFEEHKNEELINVFFGDTEVFIAKDGSYCASSDDLGKQFDENMTKEYYDIYKTEFNTITAYKN